MSRRLGRLLTNPTFTQFHVILYAMSTSPPSQITQDSLFPAAGHHSCGQTLEFGEIYICVDSSNFHSRAQACSELPKATIPPMCTFIRVPRPLPQKPHSKVACLGNGRPVLFNLQTKSVTPVEDQRGGWPGGKWVMYVSFKLAPPASTQCPRISQHYFIHICSQYPFARQKCQDLGNMLNPNPA